MIGKEQAPNTVSKANNMKQKYFEDIEVGQKDAAGEYPVSK